MVGNTGCCGRVCHCLGCLSITTFLVFLASGILAFTTISIDKAICIYGEFKCKAREECIRSGKSNTCIPSYEPEFDTARFTIGSSVAGNLTGETGDADVNDKVINDHEDFSQLARVAGDLLMGFPLPDEVQGYATEPACFIGAQKLTTTPQECYVLSSKLGKKMITTRNPYQTFESFPGQGINNGTAYEKKDTTLRTLFAIRTPVPDNDTRYLYFAMAVQALLTGVILCLLPHCLNYHGCCHHQADVAKEAPHGKAPHGQVVHASPGHAEHGNDVEKAYLLGGGHKPAPQSTSWFNCCSRSTKTAPAHH